MIFFYNIFIKLYSIAARVLSLFNPKAKKWLEGRSNIFEQLEHAFKKNEAKVIWFHCASLGEFEQARPLIEGIRKEAGIGNWELGIINKEQGIINDEVGNEKRETNNKFKILLTFFSPSGYDIRKDYEHADWIFYLPIDSKYNAEKFYKTVNPSIAIFIKYEYWFYYYTQAKKLNIPLLLVSGIFRSNQPFFKWYGGLHKQMLDCVSFFFLQNQASLNLLQSVKPDAPAMVSGDTRFDRVIEIAHHKKSFAYIEKFIGNAKVIVAGSTWTEDDEALDHYVNNHQEIKFIIAPHEITKDRLDECLKLYKNAALYSDIKSLNANTHVLIIDNIGMLSSLYSYATISFVGGGFGGDGVHNVLEPAVFGKPVVFGSIYDKFIEAVELINANGAFAVDDALQLENIFDDLLNNNLKYQNACKSSKEYVMNNAGATEKVIEYIYQNLLAKNKNQSNQSNDNQSP